MSADIHFTLYLFILCIWKFKTGSLYRPEDINIVIKCHYLSRVVVPATLHNISVKRSFYKIFVKFRNSNKNVLKIVLIIVNINKNENKSLISNQFSLNPPSKLLIFQLYIPPYRMTN